MKIVREYVPNVKLRGVNEEYSDRTEQERDAREGPKSSSRELTCFRKAVDAKFGTEIVQVDENKIIDLASGKHCNPDCLHPTDADVEPAQAEQAESVVDAQSSPTRVELK